MTQNLRSQEDQRAIKSIEFEVYGNLSFKEAIEFPVYVKESSVTFIQIKGMNKLCSKHTVNKSLVAREFYRMYLD